MQPRGQEMQETAGTHLFASVGAYGVPAMAWYGNVKPLLFEMSTGNKRTPMITSKTVGYIHSLIINTVALHNSDSPYARALRNEKWFARDMTI